MGDKSPKSIGKNKKQKDNKKDEAARKVQALTDSKKANAVNLRKK